MSVTPPNGDRGLISSTDSTLERVLGQVQAMNDQAGELRKDVQDMNQRAENDRHILHSLQKVFRVGIVAIVAIAVLIVALAFVGVNTYQTVRNTEDLSARLTDCQTPEGECARRLAQANALSRQVSVLQIEEQRITTQIEAAKASQAAGSTTAAATIASYETSLNEIKARIAEAAAELEKLAPTQPVTP